MSQFNKLNHLLPSELIKQTQLQQKVRQCLIIEIFLSSKMHQQIKKAQNIKTPIQQLSLLCDSSDIQEKSNNLQSEKREKRKDTDQPDDSFINEQLMKKLEKSIKMKQTLDWLIFNSQNMKWIFEQNELKNVLVQKALTVIRKSASIEFKIRSNDKESHKLVLFREIIHISFPNLKILHIHYKHAISLEPLSTLQCPHLSQIQFKTNHMYPTFNPLIKCNFPELKFVQLQFYEEHVAYDRQHQRIDQTFRTMVKKDLRNYDLSKLNRLRMFNTKRMVKKGDSHLDQMDKETSLFLFRHDLANVKQMAKLELECVANFNVPLNQVQSQKLILNQNKVFYSLSRKFRNSIIPQKCPWRQNSSAFRSHGQVKDIYYHWDRRYLSFYSQ